MKDNLRAACLQLTSSSDIYKNLKETKDLSNKAIDKGDVNAFNAIYNNLYGNLKDTVDVNTTEEVNHDFRNIISRIKAQ